MWPSRTEQQTCDLDIATPNATKSTSEAIKLFM